MENHTEKPGSGEGDEFSVCLCEHCGQKLQYADHREGMEIECPSCHKKTVLIFDEKVWWQSKYPGNYDDPEAQFICGCPHCCRPFKAANKLLGEYASCPECGKESLIIPDNGFLSSIQNIRAGNEAELCPRCNSPNWDIYYPNKPAVSAPSTFTGALVGGLANAMADSIFTPEKVCKSCGFRWPHRG